MIKVSVLLPVVFNQLKHVLTASVTRALSNNREECTKKKKKRARTTTEQKKSTKKPQIRIPAHLENTGMSDNKKTNLTGR